MNTHSPVRANLCLSATILCTLLIWLGGDYQARAEAGSAAVGQKGEITIEEAVNIAKAAIKKEHGWKDVQITSATLRKQNWHVTVWRLPKKPGGYSTVVISETGDVVRIERGQ